MSERIMMLAVLFVLFFLKLTLKLLALGVLILWISSQQGEVLCYFSLPLHEWPTSPGTHLFFIQMWGKYFPLPIPLNATFEIANASLELAGCLAKYFVGLMMMSSCFLIFPAFSIGIVLFGGRKALRITCVVLGNWIAGAALSEIRDV